MQNRFRLAAPLVLVAVLVVQVFTHLAWLSISTQVGQLTIPWLMARGMTLYGDLIENRPPASAALLALAFRLLPDIEPVLIVRMHNLLLVLAVTVLVFVLAKRLTGSTVAGLAASIFWALWEPVYGNLLFYFDALVGAVFAATVLVWLTIEPRRPAWLAPLLCGLLLGGATLLKQPAWAGVVLFALWLTFYSSYRRYLPAFILGVAVFPTLMVILAAAQGTLESYAYWNFTFHLASSGVSHAQPLTGTIVRKTLLANILAPAFILLALRRPPQNRRYWVLVALLWFAGGATVFPNFGEIYHMGHMPLLAVMSGIVIAAIIRTYPTLGDWHTTTDSAHLVLAGLAVAVIIGWGWTISAAYSFGPLGRASIPAYDELKPLAARVQAVSRPENTLYVLPQLDNTPQLHVLTGLLPPGTWVNSHRHILSVPGLVEQLLVEWETNPPDIVVDFPALRVASEPWIQPLNDFVQANYTIVEQVDDVPFNGDAVIYRLNTSS